MVMEMSKTYQYRKVMKPLLERKRRARINKCLDDLKDLMVECLQQEGEHVTRLEKADILELTVEHMRKLKQRGALALQPATQAANAHIESFRSGYVHAADQITQVLLQQRQTDELGGKIIKFLSTRLIEMQHQLLRTTATATTTAVATPAPAPATASGLPAMAPAIAATYPSAIGAELPEAARFQLFSSAMIGLNGKSFGLGGKDNADLIDVTTVDSQETDTASVLSMDSATSGEVVWRPW